MARKRWTWIASLGARARNASAAAGSEIVPEIPQIGVTTVRSSDPDFARAASQIAGAITAGRIIGVASEASIANSKVMVAVLALADDGYFATGIGCQSWIVDGIVTAADDGVHVVNMGLGGWRAMHEEGGAAAYVAYLHASQYARRRGTLVASSGNSGLDLTRQRQTFPVPSGTPAAMSVNAMPRAVTTRWCSTATTALPRPVWWVSVVISPMIRSAGA